MNKSKSQIASLVAAVMTFLVANWTTIAPYVDQAKQSKWFLAHPTERMLLTAFGVIIPLLARSFLAKKSGIPSQDPTITSTINPPNPAAGSAADAPNPTAGTGINPTASPTGNPQTPPSPPASTTDTPAS